MPKAERIYSRKGRSAEGGTYELVIWKLEKASATYPHGLKYRLYYGRNNTAVVLYDIHHGKPYHKHINGQEFPYEFTTVEKLLNDFLHDVAENGGQL